MVRRGRVFTTMVQQQFWWSSTSLLLRFCLLAVVETVGALCTRRQQQQPCSPALHKRGWRWGVGLDGGWGHCADDLAGEKLTAQSPGHLFRQPPSPTHFPTPTRLSMALSRSPS